MTMRTLATHQSSQDVSQRKPVRARPVFVSRIDSPVFSTVPTGLQRQPSCACGGGCPRCQENFNLQTKLKINEPGDRYEQEADRIADQIVQQPESSVQDMVNPVVETLPLQRRTTNQAAITEVPPMVHEVLNSPGQPLDTATRGLMESRFGHDFSQVRIHTNAKAAESAQAVNARAYTVGQELIFGTGQYMPATTVGKKLLAHELVHTLQQSHGDAATQIQREDGAGTPTQEEEQKKKEADTTKVVTDGVGIVLDNLDSKNPKFKALQKEVTKQVEDRAKGTWQALPTADKGALIGFGAVTLGTVGAGLLADPKGRGMLVDVMEGKNLVVPPLSWIPYMPLSSFKFKRPDTGAGASGQLKLDTALTVTPYLDLLRKRYPKVPPLDAKFDLNFEFNPTTKEMNLTGGKFNLRIFEGIGLSVGTVSSISPLPEITPTAEGGVAITQARLPKTPSIPLSPPGFQVMISIDLTKIKELPGQLDKVFKAFQ